MDISIKSGEGLSQAIKRKLQEEGATNIKGSIWGQIHQLFQNEAEGNKSTLIHNAQEADIGEEWSELKKNVLVFKNDILKIAEATWAKIKELAGVSSEGTCSDATPPARDTTPPARDTNPPARDTNPPAKDTTPPARETPPEPLSVVERGNLRKEGGSYTVPKTLGGKEEVKTCSDGFVKSEYDAAGNQIKETYYNPNGSVKGYYKSEYDAAGHEIKVTKYNPDGSVVYYYKNEYDVAGNIKETHYNPDGSVVYYSKSEYDVAGNIKETYYKPDGSVENYSKSEYDVAGHEIKRIYYNPDGSVDGYHKYEYDTAGNLIKETYYNPDGSVWELVGRV